MTLDSHHLAQVLCRPGTRVLDVGCGPGVVADRLVALGCQVVGLDIDPASVQAMEKRSLTAHVVDLDRDDLSEVLGSEEFDVIVCLDVLEHTKDPSKVLGRLLRHLSADGDVVVSLPNITHGDVRLSLLGGRFEYHPEGLLDATHLHFFDGEAVKELVADNGLAVRDLFPVRYPLGGTELGVDLETVDPQLLADLEADPDSTIYQWVFRSQRAAATDQPPPMLPLLEELAERTAAQDSVEVHQKHLLGQLEAFEDEGRRNGEHMAKLEAEILARDEYVAELQERILAADREHGEAEEEMDLLGRELHASRDVIDIVSAENTELHRRVADHAAATARVTAELAAVSGRRLYRLLDVLSRSKLVRRLAR